MRKKNIVCIAGLLIVLLFFAPLSAAQHEDIEFEPHVEYAVNTGPCSIIAADLNGDGHLDLATTCNGDFMTGAQNVSVLINNGNGTFEPHREYPTDYGPSDIAAGDLNGDGDLDLVTANPVLLGDNTVSVLLNNGDGTFAAHVEYESDTVPQAVALADIDKDGDNDIICANNMGFSLSVLLNNGDGTFAPRKDYDNEYLSVDVAVADFDKDGYYDVATINNNWLDDNQTLSVFLNVGNGSLEPYDSYTTGDSPQNLVTGDFDEDGFTDIAVSRSSGSSVDIFLNNGDGTFAERSPTDIGHGADDMYAMDIDADGHLDLVTIYVSGYISTKVGIAYGWGNASFGDAQSYTTASGSSSVIAADLDKDDKMDIAVANGGDMFGAKASVSVLIQTQADVQIDDEEPPPDDIVVGGGDRSIFDDPLNIMVFIIMVSAVVLSTVLAVSERRKDKRAARSFDSGAVAVAPVQAAVAAQTVSWEGSPAAVAAPQPQWPAAQPQASPYQRTIQCPKCGRVFNMTIAKKPAKMECPYCHVKGTYR